MIVKQKAAATVKETYERMIKILKEASTNKFFKFIYQLRINGWKPV